MAKPKINDPAPQPETANAAPASSVKVSAAPRMKSSDSIELTPLIGKLVGIECMDRSKVATKFGERQLTTARLIVEGGEEPLEGVLFQSYFQSLPLGEWFIGRVVQTKTGKRTTWGLDVNGIPKPAFSALVKAIEALPSDDDVAF